MTQWPFTIPEDLRKDLETRDGYRDPASHQDLWLIVKEWLEAHGIKAPAELPRRQEKDHHMLGH